MSDSRARDRLLGKQLASHEFADNIKGKPLNIPQVNFTIPLEKKVQAASGTPYFAVRAQQIEQTLEILIRDLTVEYRDMMAQYGNRPEVFARKWKELITALPLDMLNGLIENHNKYYPVEANLRIDTKTGAPMMGSVAWKPKEKVTVEGLLKQFPAEIPASPA